MKRMLLLAALGCCVIGVMTMSCHDETIAPKVTASILGVWDFSIAVPPGSAGVANTLTFSGDAAGGTFLDKNNHGGPWSAKGDSIRFEYKNVPGFPDLVNVFLGKVNLERTNMSGTNSGVFNGAVFNGAWTGNKK